MELQELRNKIDIVDREIVRLLNERYRIVLEVGRWKKEHNLPVYAPEREKALLEKLLALNEGSAVPPETLLAVYHEIIEGAKKIE